MNFYIYLINRIRKFFKSIGKLEKKINNYLIFLTWKKRNKLLDIKKIDYKENFINSADILHPKKIAICICFFFKEEKKQLLKNICTDLDSLADVVEVTIVTNEKEKEKLNNLKSDLSQSLKNLKFFIPENLADPRLLPWCHYLVMREKIKDKTFSHFIYLEDDIMFTKENLSYWMEARKSLKSENLLPSFVRFEINKEDKEIYTADYAKSYKLKNLPKVFSNNNSIIFTNTHFPYQGMYIYDKELMNEHLNGPSSSIDFGHGAFNTDWININSINLDVMAKANSGLMYMNIPKGFFNRHVIPVDINKKIIKNYSLIGHISNEYTNKVSDYGRIKVKNIFI